MMQLNKDRTNTILGFNIAREYLKPLIALGEDALNTGNSSSVCSISFALAANWPSSFGEDYPLETRRVIIACGERFTKRYAAFIQNSIAA